MLTPLEFTERVLLLRQIIPFSETSGGRTEKHNIAVGGVPLSAHRRDLARDIVPDEPSPEMLAKLRVEADRLDLEVIDEWATKAHYHIQPRGWAQTAW